MLYESVDSRLLVDRRATAEEIRDGLYWLQTQTTHRDNDNADLAADEIFKKNAFGFMLRAGFDYKHVRYSVLGYNYFGKDALDIDSSDVVFFSLGVYFGMVSLHN